MFRWYTACLKTRPYLTNGLTSASLVALGDLFAQKLEYDNCVDKTKNWLQTIKQSNAQLSNQAALQSFRDNFSVNRLIILSCWGGFFFAPYFVRLFRFLDSFPQIAAKTPRNIAIRVVSIYFIAQPLNFVLFPYKAITEHYFPVHHPAFPLIDDVSKQTLAQFYQKQQSVSQSTHQSTDHTVTQTMKAGALALVSEGSAMPLPLADAVESTNESTFDVLKAQVINDWQTKLPNVLKNAALVWGSWNTFNMSVVPPQYRVVASSFVSVGWNTWLSLYAHADLSEQANDQSGEQLSSVSNEQSNSVKSTVSISETLPTPSLVSQ